MTRQGDLPKIPKSKPPPIGGGLQSLAPPATTLRCIANFQTKNTKTRKLGSGIFSSVKKPTRGAEASKEAICVAQL